MKRPIKVGMVGTGFAVSTQLPGFRLQGDFDVAAICSGTLDRAEEAARVHGIPQVYPTLRTMLEADTVDLVSIASPPGLHREMAIATARAGKHVLCEKPPALDAFEAKEMLDAADSAGIVHAVDFLFRFAPARARLKELVDEGYVGRILSSQITDFVGRWADPRARLRSWMYRRETGGGALSVRGSHLIDALRHLVGEVRPIAARARTLVDMRFRPDDGQPQPAAFDDGFVALFEIASGGWATIVVNAAAWHGPGTRIEVFGSEGSLLVTPDGQLYGGRRNDPGLLPILVPDRLERTPGPALVQAFARAAGSVARAILTGSTDHPTFKDGFRVQQVIAEIRRLDNHSGF